MPRDKLAASAIFKMISASFMVGRLEMASNISFLLLIFVQASLSRIATHYCVSQFYRVYDFFNNSAVSYERKEAVPKQQTNQSWLKSTKVTMTQILELLSSSFILGFMKRLPTLVKRGAFGDNLFRFYRSCSLLDGWGVCVLWYRKKFLEPRSGEQSKMIAAVEFWITSSASHLEPRPCCNLVASVWGRILQNYHTDTRWISYFCVKY